mmetsp:Transcript_20685/g.58147  ORF Transcript_20685/g.58147 Transcript_20685/m.58147 type:complete len:153 (-) Transcript_20685:68-526(-)
MLVTEAYSGNTAGTSIEHVVIAEAVSHATKGPSELVILACGKHAFNQAKDAPPEPSGTYDQVPHFEAVKRAMLADERHGTTSVVSSHFFSWPLFVKLHPAGQDIESVNDAQSGLDVAVVARSKSATRAPLLLQPKLSADACCMAGSQLGAQQ